MRASLCLAICGVCWLTVSASAGQRPNIVFIYADDHAEAAIGAYGSRINATPAIDRLAREGMRFTRSFVANSICGPARATILTGTHSHINGRRTNHDSFNDELPSWAKRMQQAGYQTAAIGKWHLPTTPNGFDYWVKNHGYYARSIQTSAGPVKRGGYTTDLITDLMHEWIGQRDPDRPFVVWLSHNASHRTWMPPVRHLRKYDDQTIPEPATLLDDYTGRSQAAADTQMRIARDLFPAYDLKLPITGDQILDGAARGRLAGLTAEQREAWDAAYGPKNQAFAASSPEGDDLVRWKYQRYIKDYLRCVAAIDDCVGRTLDFLKDNGLEDNTIVVYSSDQGFYLGEHGWYDKRWMYEPALRTPLIVRWPGVTQPGSTCDAMVQNIDIAPTLLAAAGIEIPDTMQGESLAPLLAGKTPERWRDAIYYHYYQRANGRIMHRVAKHYGIRTDRYKLIYVYNYGDWELYDLQRDPHEVDNVYADPGYAEVVEQLKEQLVQLRKQYRDETGKPVEL